MDTVFITGTCRWAKVFKPDSKFNYYGIEVKPDEAGLAALQASGITTVKPSKDGEGYYSFKRRPDHMIWKDKQQIRAGAPKVYDNQGNETKDAIGNGSEVQVKLQPFPFKTHGGGVSCRLEAVLVQKLVPYEAKQEEDDDRGGSSPLVYVEDTPKKEPKLKIMF